MSKDIETMKPVIAGAVGNPARTCAGSCEGNAYQIEIRRLTAERDAIAAKLESVRGDQAPTTDDINLQEWKGMEGVFASHLIDRHADDWNHVAKLMNAWLEANREDLAAELKALEPKCPSYMPDWSNHGAAIADPVFHQIRGIMGTQNWGQEDALRKAVLHALRAIQRSVEASNQPTEAGYEND